MSFHYSNPAREHDEHALPDAENGDPDAVEALARVMDEEDSQAEGYDPDYNPDSEESAR